MNEERPTYRVRCERSGRWWALSVPELPGVHSQSRRLDQVEENAREAIALLLDVSEDAFDLTYDYVVPADWEPVIDRVLNDRRRAESVQREARAAVAQALNLLVDVEGLPLRDAGKLLGLSHQRVSAVRRSPDRGAGVLSVTSVATVP